MRKIIKIQEPYLNIINTIKIKGDVDIYLETLANPNYKDEYESDPIEYRVCKTLDMVTFKINRNEFDITTEIFCKNAYPRNHILRKDDTYDYLSVLFSDFDIVILRLEQAKLLKLLSVVQPIDKNKEFEGNLLPIYINPVNIFQLTYVLIYELCRYLYRKFKELKRGKLKCVK